MFESIFEAPSECLNKCVIGIWGYDEGENLTLLDAMRVVERIEE